MSGQKSKIRSDERGRESYSSFRGVVGVVLFAYFVLISRAFLYDDDGVWRVVSEALFFLAIGYVFFVVNDMDGSVSIFGGRNVRLLEKELVALRGDFDNLKRDIHETLVVQALGGDARGVPLRRFVPLRVYASNDQGEYTDRLFGEVARFTESIGFEGADEYPSEYGSWFKKWLVRAKELLTSEQLMERFESGERALQLAYVNKAQSEVDKNHSEAASNLLRAIEDIDQGVCQIGSILVVKTTDDSGRTRVVTRTLTQRELMLIERDQNLLKCPSTVLEALDRLGDS